MKKLIDYWFKLEPYVHVSIANNSALLYNTLDGMVIETDKLEVIELLKETLQKENCGVILLTLEKYKQENIKEFVEELREKYMGDVIDVNSSKRKPVQILPLFNSLKTQELFKKHNFSSDKKLLSYLSEVNVYLDFDTNITDLIFFLETLPEISTINIVGNLKKVPNYIKLLSFLNKLSSSKKMITLYKDILSLSSVFEENFSYLVLVDYPINMQEWNDSRSLLLNQPLPFEYVFKVSSTSDCLQVEELIRQFEIEKYHLEPIYTGDNIDFFEKNVFLTKEDILSTSMSINDFFTNQSINVYDFGKINIMPNGDIYANLNYPSLGNIYTSNIYEIVSKELEEGESWLRIRSQAPCNTCIYQWLCPPPSNYEISIGRPNLCHVKQS